ncbi:MAG: dimethylarginine dimethylaminohydrolase [Micropepsaceae bacterium]
MPIYDFNHALLRAPSRSVVDGLSATGLGRPGFAAILREHTAYARALEETGISVEILPPLEPYPDSVFVEDSALVFADAAIVLRPGAPTRRGEAAEIAPALARHFDRMLFLKNGSVDGGDVLTTPGNVFIGQSARTDAQGAQALIALLDEIGLRGLAVETPAGVLHFKSDCSLLDEETVLSTARLAASGVFSGLRVVLVPQGEEGAANAVRLKDRLLISDAFPRTTELLTNAGYKIAPLATREIAKLDAGLSCMSLRWSAAQSRTPQALPPSTS